MPGGLDVSDRVVALILGTGFYSFLFVSDIKDRVLLPSIYSIV